MYKVIEIFRKNSREQVRVILSDFRGLQILDIRVYWSVDGQDWKPSKKGIAMKVEKLPVLLASLHKAAVALGQEVPDETGVNEGILTAVEKAPPSGKFEIGVGEIEKSIAE